MQVGLYFGSFNPIHIGHLAIANFVTEYSSINQLWFVVSPHNPLKKKSSLLHDQFRLEMVQAAIEGDSRFQVCDIEFHMPKPSYTVDTLAYLSEKYPKHTFSLIMGSDSLRTFSRWKNSDEIMRKHKRIVFPRHGENMEYMQQHKNIEIVDAPRFEISSSFIREAIKDKKDVRYFLHPEVFKIIDKQGFYL